MWRNYFGSKVRIIEIDLNPSAKELQSYGYKFIQEVRLILNFGKSFILRFVKQIFLDNEVILNPQHIKKIHFACENINEDGLVVFENSQWRARVNRLTPIKEGESARIVGLEGLVLEVEPEEGGAVDYREMRQKEK